MSRVHGGPLGHLSVRRLDMFTRLMPRLVQRELTDAEREMYRGPHPTPQSRAPLHVFPREILDARPLLEEIERGLHLVADRPALILWGAREPAFGSAERRRFEETFSDHHTVVLKGAGHYLWEDVPGEIAAVIREWYPAVA